MFFCKPAVTDHILYSAPDNQFLGSISFRSLLPDSDIDFLHQWVNLSYSKKFWQMDGSLSNLYTIYQDVLANPQAHSFIGLLNNDPVCQIDLYHASAGEIHSHINAKEGDCDFHLLMQPPSQMKKGISVAVLKHFIRYFFSFDQATTLYAEPDNQNILAGKLAIKAGMHFQKTISLSDKTTNLYSITKKQFIQHVNV